MFSKRLAISAILGLIVCGGLGVWGLTDSSNKPRTFSKPKLISDLLKEKGRKLTPITAEYIQNPTWKNNWNKLKKEFENKKISNIWSFADDWDAFSGFSSPVVHFVESCKKFTESEISNESDEKYVAVIKFCSELI